MEVYNLNSSSSLQTLNPPGNLPCEMSQLSKMNPEMLTTMDQSEKRVPLPQIRVTKIQGSQSKAALKTDES